MARTLPNFCVVLFIVCFVSFSAFSETIHLLALPGFEPHIQITQPFAWSLY
jgi:hypothetical protein